MNSLTDLIGKTVMYTICNEDENQDENQDGYKDFRCKVIDVNICDWHFLEKGESININVNLEPLEELPEGFFYDCFNNVSLYDITKDNTIESK